MQSYQLLQRTSYRDHWGKSETIQNWVSCSLHLPSSFLKVHLQLSLQWVDDRERYARAQK